MQGDGEEHLTLRFQDDDTGNIYEILGDPGLEGISFRAGGIKRVHIGADGNVGIGTLSPSATLDVVGSTELNGNVEVTSDLDVDGNLTLTTPPVHADTLTWPAEPSAGVYNLYRDDISNGFGDCEEQDIAGTTTTDTAIPTTAFFYLATVENRLAEEGTKGFQSNATERRGGFDLPVCP